MLRCRTFLLRSDAPEDPGPCTPSAASDCVAGLCVAAHMSRSCCVGVSVGTVPESCAPVWATASLSMTPRARMKRHTVFLALASGRTKRDVSSTRDSKLGLSEDEFPVNGTNGAPFRPPRNWERLLWTEFPDLPNCGRQRRSTRPEHVYSCGRSRSRRRPCAAAQPHSVLTHFCRFPVRAAFQAPLSKHASGC